MRIRNSTGITIRNVTVQNCGGGVHLDGADADIDGLHVIDTPVALEVEGDARVNARNVVHRPNSAQQQEKAQKKPRKYFGGFSFAKGDHLKDK